MDTLYTDNGTFDIGYSRKSAFISNYEWDDNQDHMKVVLPNEFKGVPVTQLGGYFGRGVPAPFNIILNEKYSNDGITSVIPEEAPSDWYADGYTIIEYKFIIVLNSNLKELFFGGSELYFRFKHDDGKYTLYHPTYYYECAEDNKVFYCKDGVIYLKVTDEKATWTEFL